MAQGGFVELVCAVSSRLASASADRIAAEIRWALEAIREFMGADQCAFLKAVVESEAVVMLERVAIEGVPPVPTNVEYAALFPSTYRRTFREFQPYVLDRLGDLGPDEAAQRSTCEAMGLGALIALPITWSGRARYSLALGCSRSHSWPQERIAHLRALGEIIAAAYERQEDEARVRRHEAELAEAQRVARMGSWVRDLVADHFAVSEEAARILGCRPVSSAQWSELLHAEDRDRVVAALRESLAAGARTYRLEYRIVLSEGNVRVIVDEGEIAYHPEGHAASAIGTIRDVTAERLAEREVRELRGRIWHADRAARAGALGSSLAHELGQPLTAILSNAQAGVRLLATGQAAPGEIEEILESVIRDDKRAIGIIDGLRALLRKETSGRQAVDVGQALEEVVGLIRGEVDAAGARLEPQVAPGCMANAVKAQVQQVGLNLLTNALDAVRGKPVGERRIELDVGLAGDRVQVEVRDSGRGISEDPPGRIFEPFRSERSGGLGLGLTVSRSIVEAHGGRISVERNAWGGATFRFTLPAVANRPLVAPDVPANRIEPAVRKAANGASLVCIVDDDASVRNGLARLLAASGYAVSTFASGPLLLDSPELARASCALLDVRLGEVSGPDVHRAIAERYPALPVLFLTAHGDVPTGVGAMRHGAVDFLLKPIDEAALVAAVQRAVRRGDEDRLRESTRAQARARLAALSPREREILEQVVRGRLNKQIADDLGIAEATVKQHRGRVMEKTGAASVAELVRLCEAAANAHPTKVG